MKIDEKCDFDGVFELQCAIKNFLLVESSYYKYLKCSPRSGEYSALKITFIRHQNPFLLTKVLTPPLSAGLGPRFFKWEHPSLEN